MGGLPAKQKGPERVNILHKPCGFGGKTTRTNLQAVHDRHMAMRHDSNPGLMTSGRPHKSREGSDEPGASRNHAGGG
jgi:hypothetical protein